MQNIFNEKKKNLKNFKIIARIKRTHRFSTGAQKRKKKICYHFESNSNTEKQEEKGRRTRKWEGILPELGRRQQPISN